MIVPENVVAYFIRRHFLNQGLRLEILVSLLGRFDLCIRNRVFQKIHVGEIAEITVSYEKVLPSIIIEISEQSCPAPVSI